MISEELQRIKEAKDALKVSINNKGVTVTDADSISVYASKVDLIVTGKTSEMQSIDITENGKYENTSIPYSSVTVNVDDGSERIKELEDEIVDLNSQITQKENKIIELQNKLDFDEGLIEDLRNEITSLESQKTALENELNELKSKVNSMTDLTVSENGVYTPTFGYKSVTVNVPQTGSDITLTEITITDVGEYTAPEKIAYNKVLVPSETFYKKYTDGEGNTYIINENGEIVVTYTGGTPQPSNEIWYTTSDGSTVQTSQKDLISNTYVDGKGVMTFSKDVTSIDFAAFYECSGLTSIEIPNSVTSIGILAFQFCTSLTSVTIGNSVTSIEDGAFNSCYSLTSIEFPNSVTSIGERAFANCSGLTSVTMPDSVTYLGERAFANCSGLTSVTIPNSVTSIGGSAFDACKGLTSVTIPNSVTSIGERGFAICTSLKYIYYNGTKAQFTSITKGSSWKLNIPTTCIVHCTNGDYPITDF